MASIFFMNIGSTMDLKKGKTMRKIALFLFVTLIGNIQQINSAAEQPRVPTVTIVSKDKDRFEVPIKIAELSATFKNHIEDFPGDPIYLQEINSDTLNRLISLMTFVLLLPRHNDTFQIISSQISKELRNATVDQWANILYAARFLDIEDLLEPTADGMIKFITSINTHYLDILLRRDNKLAIESTISRLSLPDELKGLLAKHWYYNYGEEGNFILPDLDYGFSIAELAAHHKLPPIRILQIPILSLDGLRINNLDGLNSIPNLETVRSLNLSNNRLISLPKGAFEALGNVRWLYLHQNKLENISDGALDKLTKLDELYLPNNNLSILSAHVFDKLDQLRSLNLRGNKLTKLTEGIFDNLYYLQYLYLDYNKLAELPLTLFDELPYLLELNLSHNAISALPDGIFDILAQPWPPKVVPGKEFRQSWVPPRIYLNNNPLTEAQKEALKNRYHRIVRF